MTNLILPNGEHEAVDAPMDILVRRIQEMERRVIALEQQFSEMSQDTTGLKRRVKDLEEIVNVLNARLEKRENGEDASEESEEECDGVDTLQDSKAEGRPNKKQKK